VRRNEREVEGCRIVLEINRAVPPGRWRVRCGDVPLGGLGLREDGSATIKSRTESLLILNQTVAVTHDAEHTVCCHIDDRLFSRHGHVAFVGPIGHACKDRAFGYREKDVIEIGESRHRF